MLPPKRSLKSWLALSQGDTTNLSKEHPYIQGDNNQMDNRIINYHQNNYRSRATEWTGQCIAHNN